MAKLPAKTARIWVDEHALSGYLSAADFKLDQETVKVDVLASVGPERVVGNYDHSWSFQGFYDGDDDSFDEIAFANLQSDEAHHAFLALTGATEGSIGYESPVRFKGQTRPVAVGQAILLNLEAEGAGPVARATILRTATVTGTGDGTGQNMGATSSGQLLVATYRILAVDGSGSIVLQIHESSDNGGGDAYANVAALASGTLTGVGVTRVSTTGATEAWKRVTVSTFSGFTSVTALVTLGVAAA